MNKKPFMLFGVLLGLLPAVIVYLVTESLAGRDIAIENNFQQWVHGVGLDATTKPTWCYIDFDPEGWLIFPSDFPRKHQSLTQFSI